MTDKLHRTQDWNRLSRSGLFAVRDGPGEITLTAEPPIKGLRRFFKGAMIGLPVLGLLAGHVFGLVICLMVGPLVFGTPLLWIGLQLRRFADTAIFRPEGVYAFRKRRQLAFLPREAMQQIAADQDANGVRFHRFVADVGYFSAFPGHKAADQALMNNVLMAAFAQPLHLDLAQMQRADHPAPAPDLRLMPQPGI